MRKNLLLSAAAIFFAIHLYSQNTSPYWSLAGNSNATSSSKLGTTNSIPLAFFTGNAERMRIDLTGKVGIGTTAPKGKLTIQSSGSAPAASWVSSGVPLFAGFGENTAGNADDILAMASNTASARAVFLGRKSRGTLAAPTAVQNNDYLLSLYSSGYDGGTFQAPATVDFFVDGPVSSGHVPARISLSTGSGFGDRIERLKVGSTGNISFNNNQLYINQSTGFVGLGTNTPAKKLQITDGDIRSQTSNAVAQYLEFVQSGTPIDWRWEHSYNGRYFYFSYSTNDFQSFIDKLYIDTASYTTGASFVLYGKALSYGWDVFSDGKLKSNVQDVANASAIIARLQPKTYNFRQQEFPALNLPAQRQYGLIAQDVEKILPELVTTAKMPIQKGGNGNRTEEEIKSINYTELIPLLIKGAQEQQGKIQKQDSLIADQQKQIEELKSMVTKLANGQLISTTASSGELAQNTPNPGNSSTMIAYALPQNARHAKLTITDNSGRLVQTIQLTTSGKINVNTATLNGGVYNYSLIVDDKIIDTKQMVIAR